MLHSRLLPYKALISVLAYVKYLEDLLTSAEHYFCTCIIITENIGYLFYYMLSIAGFKFHSVKHPKRPFEDSNVTFIT